MSAELKEKLGKLRERLLDLSRKNHLKASGGSAFGDALDGT